MTNEPEQTNQQQQRRFAPARLRLNQSLSIDGLPPSLAALATGLVYAVYASRSPARDALFWKTAVTALATPVTILSTRTPEEVALALKQHGLDIDEPGAVHPRSNICCLRLPPNRDGCEVLIEALQALSDQCASPATQFLIEGAAACFAWQDRETLIRQGAALASWCAQTRHSVLLVMLPPLVEQGGGFLPLTDFQIRFGGAAQLLQVQGEFRWEVAFWRDNRNKLAAAESIPLRFSATDHRLVAVLDEAKERTGMLAPDEKTVMVSGDAVRNERSVPRDWQVLPDNSALVKAAGHAVAATVIFHYGINENLGKLAKHVNFLRRECGKALKILIREDNVSIRYELLMLSLGANAIIPRNTTLAQVEVQVDGVQGQLFSRPVPEDYRAALAAAMRDSTTGYVPAQRFIALVREAVERSRPIRLPNVLLQLPLEPDVAGVDAVRSCRMRRAGDLCTASGDSVYLFFFACHVDYAGKAAVKVFDRPLSELFRGELRCGDRDTILSMLTTLEDEVTELPPPDYSSLIDTAPSHVAVPLEPQADAKAETSPAEELDGLPLPGLSDGVTAGSASAAAVAAVRRPPRPASLPLKARG
ncbi:cellulose biosynthesis protein BcsE [Dyella solisilvae]|uniref:Cellulose biosynthesis protein BcsE n=1 Tax=Dyella solisilvae TaxID=1920168 RepID=A0A370KA86_9GAMM|nr:cellulose biosynthesis protein BcsE [Dyella solisilvae]RDI99561.1 cellulose biosynthesis protein BcsE [Dyella solisilvae]